MSDSKKTVLRQLIKYEVWYIQVKLSQFQALWKGDW